jgi:hypothetical protein
VIGAPWLAGGGVLPTGNRASTGRTVRFVTDRARLGNAPAPRVEGTIAAHEWQRLPSWRPCAIPPREITRGSRVRAVARTLRTIGTFAPTIPEVTV